MARTRPVQSGNSRLAVIHSPRGVLLLNNPIETPWDADPLDAYGGFGNLSYDLNSSYVSALAPRGLTRWSALSADESASGEGHARVSLSVGFPDVEWTFIQTIYGWAALQYQAWARGNLTVISDDVVTVSISMPGLLEIWVDKKPYFGGDFYSFRKAPLFLALEPGTHVLDVRLVRDVRSSRGSNGPLVTGILEINQVIERLVIDPRNLLTGEVVNGRLISSLASVNIQNPIPAWVEVISIETVAVSHNIL